ncbi:MAG: hypothetical protein M1355_04455 [Patescibacteria group bacterium]|nr:hypothetical protein [Patescibacteria group bacterium]
MKKPVIIFSIIGVVLVLGAGGFLGWNYFLKKAPAGEACKADSKCVSGFKCLSGKCSSGETGSSCSQKSDCKSSLCVNNKCTEGKISDPCSTYKDCKDGLLCKRSICTAKPSYTKYFDRIDVSKMKQGMPPGPDNIPVATTKFLKTDAIEVDITNSKKTAGEFWVEVVNLTTGEKLLESEKQQINDSRGTGMGIPSGAEAGEYEVNVYFNNELIHTVEITIE